MKKDGSALRRWEIALLFGLSFALVAGAWANGRQRSLEERVVRLHVVGASDSAEDQAVKLKVRDAVLALAQPELERCEDQEEAMAYLARALPDLAQAGAEAAGVPVTAEIAGRAWYPARRWAGGELPAGDYAAVRVTVGEGSGRNWWGVVFPSLTAGAVTEEVKETSGGLTERGTSLVPAADGGYAVGSRLLELWRAWTCRSS